MRTSVKLVISSLMAAVVVPILGMTQASASTTAPAVAAAPVVTVAPTAVAAAPLYFMAKSGHVSIPSNYVYNPNAKKQKTLHDYCTKSPDSFPSPGKNADFRGPCARHDMCIQYKSKKRSSCDSDLLNNMYNECKYTYGTFDPRRYPCLDTAKVYWAVVRTKTVFS